MPDTFFKNLHSLLLKLCRLIQAAIFFSIIWSLTPVLSQAQELKLDVPFVSTPHEVVGKMLDLAGVGPGDYVIDLGSGDGRIVIAAAHLGAAGHGVDLDPELVKKAEKIASDEGVSSRVMFLEEDVFETDFSRATVVTMYLFTSVNLELRPRLIEELSPGTRVVSHIFDMGEWKPDKHVKMGNHNIYYWLIPADTEGNWEWEIDGCIFEMNIEQTFQEISATVISGGYEWIAQKTELAGSRITLLVKNPDNGVQYLFSGKVDRNRMNGTIQVRDGASREILPWSAIRK